MPLLAAVSVPHVAVAWALVPVRAAGDLDPSRLGHAVVALWLGALRVAAAVQGSCAPPPAGAVRGGGPGARDHEVRGAADEG